jgi:D-serine deaminase-like pyridoxal phosphate-dependent protein
MGPSTPFLVVDLDAFDRNAVRMAERIVRQGGKRWRPHVKAMRVPALAHRLVAAGAHGVTVATVDEAESMVEASLHDVLIANQVVGADKVHRVAHLNRRSRVSVAVDDEVHLAPLDRVGRDVGVRIPVLVEVDVGLQRAGVRDAAAAARLARAIRPCRALRFVGVMAWEGHASRLADLDARRTEIRAAMGRLVAAAGACAEAGEACEIVSGAGTATYEVASHCPGLTEIQAGGGAFGDRRCREQFLLPHEAALTVVASVVSRPAPTRVVLDAGFKALGTTPIAASLRGHPDASIAWSAEHATVELTAPAARIAIGDRMEFDVGYADSTVWLHDRIYGTRGGELCECWPVTRRATGIDDRSQFPDFPVAPAGADRRRRLA